MESFIGRVSSISDSIGEQSVRALGGVLDGLTSPPSSDRLRGYRDDEETADSGGGDGQRRPRSSGDDDGDDGRPGGRATIPAASSGGLGGWLGRLAQQGSGGGFASAEDALDAEPLVGRGTDGAPGPSRAAGAGLGGGFLGGSFGASLGALPLPAGASSSELLASLRAGASSASSLAAAAAAAARDSGAALASGAVSKAREGTAALSLAGVPLPSSLAAAAEPPPDPACALCARYCPCPGLSYSTRLVGFAVCFLLGFVLSLASLTSLTQLLLGNPRPFATKYTLGNLISLCSSMFVMGPTAQCNNMFHPDRRGATLLYLASMLGTFLACSALQSGLLALLCVSFQMGALLWYVFSYIPYGRACLRRCCNSALRLAA